MRYVRRGRLPVRSAITAAVASTLWLWLTLMRSAAPAAAHANLLRTSPAANSVLPNPPAAVQLWFSEPPEPRFSEVMIYSGGRRQISTGPVQVAPEDRTSLLVTLDPIPEGTYSVAWKTVSAVDGHSTAGTFAFAIGVGQSAGAGASGPAITISGQPVAGATQEMSQARPLETALRWLMYLAMAALLGVVAFPLLVLERALRAAGRSLAGRSLAGRSLARADSAWLGAVRLASTRALLRAATWLLWGNVVLTVVGAAVQAARAANVSVLQASMPSTTSPLGVLILQTRYGQIILSRLLLLGSLAVALSALRAGRRTPDRRTRVSWLVAAGVAALLPLTFSLSSHAAAASGAPGGALTALLVDWIHLVATGLWIGGLFALLLTLVPALPAAGTEHRTALVAELTPAFSVLALVCVAAIVLTGTYASLVEVASWSALVATVYGRALLIKLGLFGFLMALGAANLLYWPRRLARASRDEPAGRAAVRGFRLTVGTEAVLAAGVLLAVGVMTLSQPAKDAWAELSRGITKEQVAGDLQLRLRVTPAVAGFNEYALRIRDRSGHAVSGIEKAALIFTMVEHDMGQTELVLALGDDGWYRASSGDAAMVGTWRAEALVRRQGHDDVRSTFELALADPSSSMMNAVGPGMPPAGTPVAPSAARLLGNPVPPAEESLATGGRIYTERCMVCHGASGRGDGPAARTLRPAPADLTQHVPLHTDGELWWWITNGVSGTQMPAWKDVLSDVERWDVVNYLRRSLAPSTG